MELYMAVNCETGEVRVFLYEGDLKQFAKDQEYAYEYFELSGVNQLYYSELMQED